MENIRRENNGMKAQKQFEEYKMRKEWSKGSEIVSKSVR